MKKTLKYIFHIDHLLITILTFVLIGVGYAAVMSFPFFDPLKQAMSDMSMTDYFFSLADKNSDLNQDITVVDIKDEAGRGKIAQAIATVDSLEPWAIGVDIMFKGIKGTAAENEALIEAALKAGDKAVWATQLVDYDFEKKTFAQRRSSFFAEDLGVKEGFSNLDDVDYSHKTIRKMFTAVDGNQGKLASLPVAIAQTVDSSNVKPNDKLTIDYKTKFVVLPIDSIPTHEELIKNHIVLIGSTTDEGDMWKTPLGKMPGVVLQAYSVYTVRNHSHIHYASYLVNLLIAFVLCYLFEVLVDVQNRWLSRKKSAWAVFLSRSYLLLRIVTIVFMALVTWCTLSLFIHHSTYVDAILILLVLGVLSEARNIYIGAISALSKNHNWWILKNSLFNNNKK